MFMILIIFYECSSLSKLPNISKWKINKNMFEKCISLSFIPPIYENKKDDISFFVYKHDIINCLNVDLSYIPISIKNRYRNYFGFWPLID